jgi:hypothetical protein
MSDDRRPETEQQDASSDEPTKGPSLTLLYSLIALALAAAIAVAALIVRPFYLHR